MRVVSAAAVGGWATREVGGRGRRSGGGGGRVGGGGGYVGGGGTVKPLLICYRKIRDGWKDKMGLVDHTGAGWRRRVRDGE